VARLLATGRPRDRFPPLAPPIGLVLVQRLSSCHDLDLGRRIGTVLADLSLRHQYAHLEQDAATD